MATIDNHETSVIPPDILADLDAIVRQGAAGGECDAELLRRVNERSAQAQEELRKKYGDSNVAAALIQEGLDEESAVSPSHTCNPTGCG